jgi:dCTP deaminase
LAQGILVDQDLHALFESGALSSLQLLAEKQIQPASLDLRLSRKAYRVRASFLPGAGVSVDTRLKDLTLHEISLAEGAVLEVGCVYIVPLQESMALPNDLSGTTNPKSSTGRLDVFTRVIADGAQAFDTIREGYVGPLYCEISPRTFPILVHEGSRLVQLRLRRGDARLDDVALSDLHHKSSLVAETQAHIRDGLCLQIDLKGEGVKGMSADLIGYRAKRHTGVIDMERIGAYAVDDFFEPLRLAKDGRLILDPGQFYILASREAVHIPPGFAAEMVPIDPLMGEFRVHYAGFFDPGFGHAGAGGHGARAVLEVRSHDVPFVLEHGQSVARLVYEKLAGEPTALYGQIGSNYQGQGLKLSKHFQTA